MLDREIEGVSNTQIMISILMGVFHVVLELINLTIEAKTSETPFKSYVITCYNSRENWFPRQTLLQEREILQIENQEP